MISSTMKAAYVVGNNKVEVRETATPKLWNDNSILIKNRATSLCSLTDLHLREGAAPHNGPVGTNETTDPYIVGHEVCGEVIEKGDNVTDVEIGDRVSLRGWFCSGGLAEYVCTDVDYMKIPENFTDHEGALIEMLAAVWLLAEQVLRIGESVVLIGHGGAGTYFNKLIQAAGITNSIVIEPHPEKRAYAKTLGATHVIDPYNEDVLKKVTEYTNGERADTVIEAVGDPDTILMMTSLVARGGKVGMFGVPRKPILGDFLNIHENATAVFSAGYHYDYVPLAHKRAIDLIQSKVIDLSDMVTHRISIDDVPNALDMVEAKKENIRKIIVDF